MKASDFFCPKFIAGAMVSLAISAAGYALILKPYHDVSLRSAVVNTNVVANYYAIKDPVNTARQAVDKALGQGSGAAYFVQTRIIIEDEMKARGLTAQSTPEELSKVDLSKVDALLLDSVNVLSDVELHQYLNADAARFDLLARFKLFGAVDPLPERMPDYFITTASGLSKDDQGRLTECRTQLNKKVGPLYVALHSDASGMCKQPEPVKAIPAS